MIVDIRIQISVALQINSHNMIPPHASSLYKFDNKFFSKKTNIKFDLMKNRVTKQFLKLEIQDACCRINYARNQMCDISYKIFLRVPVSVCNNFFSTQNKSNHNFYLNENYRLNKKFNWLSNKKTQQIQTKKVTYYYYVPQTKNSQDSRLNHYSVGDLSLSKHSRPNLEINITPPSNLKVQHPLDINKKWFINLSSTSVPTDIQSFLQLGANFSLPFYNKEKLTIEFIKKRGK